MEKMIDSQGLVGDDGLILSSTSPRTVSLLIVAVKLEVVKKSFLYTKHPLVIKLPRGGTMPRNGKKLLWKPGTMLYPVPAVLVSCGEHGGVRNIITIAWTGVVCTDPAMCSISIRPQRFSYELIRQNGEFAINLTTAAMARAVDWCGVKSGRDFDKFREMKLTPLAAKFIRPPLVAESPVNLECRVKEVRELGSHHLFIAEILAVHADPAYFDLKTGFFNLAAAEPLCYCHGHYYCLGKHIGKFGFSVEKKKKKRPHRK